MSDYLDRQGNRLLGAGVTLMERDRAVTITLLFLCANSTAPILNLYLGLAESLNPDKVLVRRVKEIVI